MNRDPQHPLSGSDELRRADTANGESGVTEHPSSAIPHTRDETEDHADDPADGAG